MARKAGITDYSKWDNIELSDDESDVHPNIEKGTWFRLKHQQRVQREEEEAKEVEQLTKDMAEAKEKLGQDISASEKEKQQAIIDKAKARLEKMEKNKKWNVDNICKVKEERTLVNHENASGSHSDGYSLPPSTEKDKSFMKGDALSEDTKVQSYQEYEEKYKDLLDSFSCLKSIEDTHKMLLENGNILLQEHASWHLLLGCLEMEMAGKRDKMKIMARQSQVLSSITELAKTERRHPGNIVNPFFEKLKDPKRFSVFLEGVDSFAQRIVDRAVEKKKEQDLGLPPGGDKYSEGMIVEITGLKGAAHLNGLRAEIKGRLKSGRIGVIVPEHGEKALKEENLIVIDLATLKKEQEEKEELESSPDYCWWLPNDVPREERLGPGGVDPVELFKELPRCLQDAFRSREIEPLHKAIEELGNEDAEKWLKKCTAAGLWNAEGNTEGDTEEEPPKKPTPAM
eukprot:TRINITY_DN10698_c0_g1_i1.p2 TRINITY_DN10698_c0_g1~~TRINITY_DN10698_c0_g1_i1.p2  ORF type:complete len:456 (+),score=159.24 TRINITY_DN10698_c0_g1_i1:1620-2987(+)